MKVYQKQLLLLLLLFRVPVHVPRGRHLVRLGLFPLPGTGADHLSIEVVGELEIGQVLTVRLTPRLAGLTHREPPGHTATLLGLPVVLPTTSVLLELIFEMIYIYMSHDDIC